MDEYNFPNFDGLTGDELKQIALEIEVNPRIVANKYFPDKPKGFVRVTKDFKNYCWNSFTARQLRLEGNINRAMFYEEICQRIYNRLPDWAKW